MNSIRLLAEAGEAGWKQSKSLIVVTNGALGLLPLSLLADRAGPDRCQRRSVVFELSRGAVAGPDPCCHDGAVLCSAAHLAPICRRANRDVASSLRSAIHCSVKQQAAEAAKAETLIKVADTGAVTTRGMPLKRRSSPEA